MSGQYLNTITPPRCKLKYLYTMIYQTDHRKQWTSKFECIPSRAHKNGRLRVRACNYIKIKTGRNFPPVLKLATRTAQAA